MTTDLQQLEDECHQYNLTSDFAEYILKKTQT
jgi:hypothetical protein